jgi:RNA polymerase sigma factor (sigma-70 family)
MKNAERSTELVGLAARARDGDPHALERFLVEVHVHVHRYLTRWLYRRRGWEDTADDLAQETLIRIARGLDGCGAVNDTMLLEWVRTVTRNVGTDYLRSMRDEWEQSEFLRTVNAAVDSELWEREIEKWEREIIELGPGIMLRILREAHATESEDAQALLWHRLVQGDEWSETGDAVGIAHTAAKRRYQRAQARLRHAVLKRILALSPEELSAIRRWMARIDMPMSSLIRSGHHDDA